MKLRLFVFTLSLLAIISSLLAPRVHADDAFTVDSNVTYKVEDSGKTLVTHDITLENLYSTLYATTYTLSLENITAEQVLAQNDRGEPIKVEKSQDGGKLNLKLTFSDSVVGKGQKRNFKISYENGGFAIKTGEVWEISIPRLSDDSSFRNYNIFLEVPDSLGSEAYISPQPSSSNNSNGFKYYSFSKSSINSTGVTAGFGQFQVFSFNLSYHLENPLAVNSQTEVAIPPDTAFQKVYFTKLDSKPSDIRIDSDGNWLAVYKLTPRQRVDVNLVGYVQIFASYRSFPKPSLSSLNKNLLPTDYWQVNNEEIKALAEKLKTPSAIYDYVSKNLKYNYQRVQPNVQRMGAASALASPDQAICMEFTDLFIALARAAGIPAREVNGYAYTENKELQPISLVNDVLHAWPEYYDKDRDAWIPVDPTWGSTSGIDYFNKLDLRHFAFVIHGESDKEPYPPGSYKLGANPQKDVFVSFGQLPIARNSIPRIIVNPLRTLPFLDSIYSVKVYNPGPSSLDIFYPTVYFDNVEHARDFVQILPPYATYRTQISIPFSILGKETPDSIKVVVNETHVELPTNKSQIVVNSLLLLFFIFIFIVIGVLIKIRIIKLERILGIIASVYAKIIGKSKENSHSTGSGL